jgi:hypothetical protein
MLDYLADHHAATDVQGGVGYHGVKTVGLTSPNQQTALRLRNLDDLSHPMAPSPVRQPIEATQSLMSDAQRRGLEFLDNGDGTFTITGAKKGVFGGMPASELKERLGELGPSPYRGRPTEGPHLPAMDFGQLEATPGKYVGGYRWWEPEWQAGENSGAVTQKLVDRYNAEPHATERWQENFFPEAERLREKNQADRAEMAKGRTGRKDVLNLRAKLADMGPDRFRKWWSGLTSAQKKAAGLPVAAAGLEQLLNQNRESNGTGD